MFSMRIASKTLLHRNYITSSWSSLLLAPSTPQQLPPTAAAAARRLLVTTNVIRGLSSLALPDVIVTKSCAKKIISMRVVDDKPELKLRLFVESGGCSGFNYVFEFDDEPVDEVKYVLFLY